jgi:hypothetical protein
LQFSSGLGVRQTDPKAVERIAAALEVEINIAAKFKLGHGVFQTRPLEVRSRRMLCGVGRNWI